MPGMKMFDNGQNSAAWDGMTKPMPFQGGHAQAPSSGPLNLNGLYWQPGDTLQSYQSRLNQFLNSPQYQQLAKSMNNDMAAYWQYQKEKGQYGVDENGNSLNMNTMNSMTTPSSMTDPYNMGALMPGMSMNVPKNYGMPPNPYGSSYNPSNNAANNQWNPASPTVEPNDGTGTWHASSK
jgi:hypothetical protein